MVIRVRGYLTFRDVIGDQWVEESRDQKFTLWELLEGITAALRDHDREGMLEPTTGQINRQVSILVNGRHHTHLPDKLDTELEDGDEVAIFPPIAGG